ncbi:hypothetical protein [Bacillus sp. V2I10]|uniref:hypothetical protein n=1 Tax=Bacillus sp. V2I10 TaxID=3042276 RepID=UPI0027896963|nr:hypothetical protein [Bacillus sp. V2I10]MDQ0859405.1 hypothetical protein [Bacillus sp. V2I10]
MLVDASAAYIDAETLLEHSGTLGKITCSLNVYFKQQFDPVLEKMFEILSNKNQTSNGVFRLRRNLKTPVMDLEMAAEIAFLIQSFGTCKSLYIKRSKPNHRSYIIISATFEKRVMAHLEYSFLPDEPVLLEAEWSGQNSIVEYFTEKAPIMQTKGPAEVNDVLKKSFPITNELLEASLKLKRQFSRIKEAGG